MIAAMIAITIRLFTDLGCVLEFIIELMAVLTPHENVFSIYFHYIRPITCVIDGCVYNYANLLIGKLIHLTVATLVMWSYHSFVGKLQRWSIT